MRKDILLPVLSLAGGIGGFLLRRRQLAAAYVPETGLFVHGAPATLALLGLAGLLALAFLLLVQHREGPEDFLPAFQGQGEGQMAAFTAAWLLMMLAGGLGIQSGLRGVRMWRSAPGLYSFPDSGSRLLAGALCVLAGFGVLYMGRMAYGGKRAPHREELERRGFRLASFPAFAGLVWLFSTHLRNGTEPVLMKYGFQMAAILLLTLAHYYVAAFLFSRPRRRRTLFLALMGSAAGITALADRPDWFTTFGLLAFTLSALTFARALLRNTFTNPKEGKH